MWVKFTAFKTLLFNGIAALRHTRPNWNQSLIKHNNLTAYINRARLTLTQRPTSQRPVRVAMPFVKPPSWLYRLPMCVSFFFMRSSQSIMIFYLLYKQGGADVRKSKSICSEPTPSVTFWQKFFPNIFPWLSNSSVVTPSFLSLCLFVTSASLFRAQRGALARTVRFFTQRRHTFPRLGGGHSRLAVCSRWMCTCVLICSKCRNVRL